MTQKIGRISETEIPQNNQNMLSPDIAEQLEMAGRVQRNFLPSRLPNTEHFHFAALFRPAEWVSGDIYDARRLDEKHIGFYIADAVGHSMPAALLTIFIKQSMVMRQTYEHSWQIFPPKQVISNLNLKMIEQELQGCLFSTACYFLLNCETLEARWARAGHPYPILIRDGKPKLLESRGGLLGVFEQTQFEEKCIQLCPGDKLLLYSDGAEPLIGTGKDTEFCFHFSFLDLCTLPVDELIAALDHLADTFKSAPGQKDDITALALQVV
ncbi:MAG TPA: PP2C family protein-serine/threonine phosphatase [Anaerohalosphaeraceae bacterium]|nr:PP2C family protein-serine/threonine phosphatase [Anaerohalosphaeraceae bacterium]HOL88974.1 PP2C family protein-serine/threonine phosphatase [Anaerohalosphaeraceae bacterium]